MVKNGINITTPRIGLLLITQILLSLKHKIIPIQFKLSFSFVSFIRLLSNQKQQACKERVVET